MLPAWPIVGMLACYPLWWALGLGVLIFPILAVPMMYLLARGRTLGRPVRLPPGFAWWALFLVVVVVSIGALGADPSGTVPERATDRVVAVLFRLTMDEYREHPNLLPRAEVFIRSMQAHYARVAGLIAQTWELSDASVRALTQQAEQVSPAEMSDAGRSVYYGELCGSLALLHERGAYSVDGAQAMLMQQGAPRKIVHAMWHAAVSAGEES